jgi:CubicO group peptidase (beta-lactamase class C family)
MSITPPAVKIHGTVARGYEGVRQAFAENFASGQELGSAFAVFHGATPLVDLWAGHANADRTVEVTERTVYGINSSSKGLAAVAIAILVDRNKLDYEQPVSTYWPEFARGGKSAITVGELMSHQAGLVGTRAPVALEDFMEQRRVAALLAEQEPFFGPGVWGYHALTIGTLADELVRRVDGRTLSAFFTEEVTRALGLDAFLGLPAAEDHRCAEMVGNFDPSGLAFDLPDAECAQAALGNPPIEANWANSRRWREAGQAGAGACASARGLSRLYSLLVCHGLPGIDPLVSREVVEQARRERISGIDKVGGWVGRYGAGFRLNTGSMGSSTDAFGHSGAGGSVAFADPLRQLGIAYTPNRLVFPDWQLIDPRLLPLLRTLYAADREQRAAV